MLPIPPRPTLFPYTTLFRSSAASQRGSILASCWPTAVSRSSREGTGSPAAAREVAVGTGRSAGSWVRLSPRPTTAAGWVAGPEIGRAACRGGGDGGGGVGD